MPIMNIESLWKELGIMLVVELRYTQPIEIIEQYLQAHRDFLQQYYDEGIFIASGPQEPRVGGIIIANTDKETMNNIIQQDPFHKNAIAEYSITVFTAVKHCEALRPLLTP